MPLLAAGGNARRGHGANIDIGMTRKHRRNGRQTSRPTLRVFSAFDARFLRFSPFLLTAPRHARHSAYGRLRKLVSPYVTFSFVAPWSVKVRLGPAGRTKMRFPNIRIECTAWRCPLLRS